MPSPDLSIIIPTFNEAGNIRPLHARIDRALAGLTWELLFVDDNSTDGTPQEVFNLGQEDERVRLVLRLADRGLAKSAMQGMLSAKGAVLCVMDGDGQHDPAVIPRMLSQLSAHGLDAVSAARQLEDISQDSVLSPRRQAMSKLANRLSGHFTGRALIDPMTGFFVIRRDRLLAVAPTLSDAGFKLLLDILHSDKALRHAEVPFTFGARESGTSKLDPFVLWQFSMFLLSKLTRDVLPASFISFVLVGGSGMIVHFGVLYALLALVPSFALAQALATVCAATSNFLLNNLLTFRDRRLRGWRMVSGYLKFMAVASVGIVANVSAASVALGRFTDTVFVAALAGIVIDTIWKFVISNRFVWR